MVCIRIDECHDTLDDFYKKMSSPVTYQFPHSAVPQELADMIIDHLHDDKKTLKMCSLVCKGWVPSSSFHLFSKFTWPPCGEDGSYFRSNARMRIYTLSDLSSNSYKRLHGSIRWLQLGVPCAGSPEYRGFSPQDLFKVVASLPRLYGLILDHCGFRHEPLFPPSTSDISGVRKLRLRYNCSLPRAKLENLWNVIANFCSISSIDISYRVLQPSLRIRTPPRNLLKIKDLTIRSDLSNMDPLLSFLNHMVDLTSVENLNLTWLPLMPSIEPLIQQMANLKSIFFAVRPATPQSALFPLQNLHDGLDRISIVASFFITSYWENGLHDPKVEEEENSWAPLLRDLEALAPTNPQKLEIYMQIDGNIPINFEIVKAVILSQDWNAMAAVLRMYRSLQAVRMGIVSTPSWSASELEDIRVDLPTSIAPSLQLVSLDYGALFCIDDYD